MTLTFEQLLTPEGTVIAGGLITAIVELLKSAIPWLDERFSGAFQAFILSAALYGAAAAVLQPSDPNVYLTLVFSWLATATTAVGVKSAAVHAAGEDRGAAVDTP